MTGWVLILQLCKLFQFSVVKSLIEMLNKFKVTKPLGYTECLITEWPMLLTTEIYEIKTFPCAF